MLLKNKTANLLLISIALAGLLLRLLFVFKINAVLYGVDNQYLNGDSYSYSQSIINFIEHGKYGFNIDNPDSYFGRLPGYPILWGLIYLLSNGHNTILWAAVFQAIIDTVAIVLLAQTIFRLSGRRLPALIGALIYATYFFILVWVPVTGTESFATFCCIFLVYFLTRPSRRPMLKAFITGLIIAVCFYVREYLGIFIVLAGLYYFIGWLKKKNDFKVVLFLGTGFVLLYMLWPLRNYVNYHRFILVKEITAGYKAYNKDYSSFRSWMYTWHTDVEPYHTQIIQTNDPVVFPDFVYNNNHAAVDSLVSLARQKGSGFFYWKNPSALKTAHLAIDSVNNNEQIAAGFDNLARDMKKRHPGRYYFTVPLLNMQKAFFKSGLNDGRDKGGGGAKALAARILFGYRSLLLLLGLAGLFVMPRGIVRFLIAGYFIFLYAFICIGLRQVEMRYLLQADVLMLIPASLLLAKWIQKFRKRTDHYPQIKA